MAAASSGEAISTSPTPSSKTIPRAGTASAIYCDGDVLLISGSDFRDNGDLSVAAADCQVDTADLTLRAVPFRAARRRLARSRSAIASSRSATATSLWRSRNADVVVDSSLFQHTNRGADWALLIDYGDILITNCDFLDDYGGGVKAQSPDSLTIRDCLFAGLGSTAGALQ